MKNFHRDMPDSQFENTIRRKPRLPKSRVEISENRDELDPLRGLHESPVKSGPNGYAEEFSPEFIQLYRQPEPALIDFNSYTDIGVADEISAWLDDPDALADAINGMEPAQIFQRIENSIADLESMAPEITK